MIFNVPTCSECIYANEYVPSYTFPFSNPRCSIHHKVVNPDTVCCEFFDNGKSKEHRCKMCGVNISDLVKEEEINAKLCNRPVKIVEYCEYCKK